MVDAGHDDTITSAQGVRPVVENEIHASIDDNIEIDGVGVVHRDGRSRVEVEHQRSSGPGNKSLLNVIP